MHPIVFAAFERHCAALKPAGAVLEIGAEARADTLLNLPSLAATKSREGINPAPQPAGRYPIHAGTGNSMPEFADGSFDLVLCNSVLEHDASFWLTLSEIRRVVRPGGAVVLGVPGYSTRGGPGRGLARLASRLWREGLPGGALFAGLAAATPTLNVHNYPGDYYRFSVQAMREVLLKGFEVMALEELMLPPRIIGVGRKP